MSEEEGASLELSCIKCGLPIRVPVEEFRKLVTTGQPLVFGHDTCPPTDGHAGSEEEQGLHRFQVVIVVREILEEADDGRVKRAKVLARNGARATGPNFSAVVEQLGTDLNQQWIQMLQMAPVIDEDYNE